jgi:hypothetical protein
MMVSHKTGILGDAWVGRSIRRLEDPALVSGQGALFRRSASRLSRMLRAQPGRRRECPQHYSPR